MTEQAAVLDHFDADFLELDGVTDDDIADFLLSFCDRIADEDGRSYWRLSRRARLDIWNHISRESLARARKVVRVAPDGATQRAIDTVLNESVPPPGDLDDDDLRAILVVLSWLPAGMSRIGTPTELYDVEFERRSITAPLRTTLDRPVLGRDTILTRLSDLVVSANASRLVIYGVGGVGKSTILAELLLRRLPDETAFAYLNFDRGLLTASRPHGLLKEIVWQLKRLRPEVRSTELDHWIGSLESDSARSRGLQSAASEIELQKAVSESLIRDLASMPNLRRLPVVVVLDSYEEVQRGTPGASYLLWELFAQLAVALPQWTVLAAGRSPIPESLAAHEHLGELDRNDALVLLQSLLQRARPPAMLERVIELVRPNPLSLRLAARVLDQSDVDDPNLLLDVVDDNVHGQLYARILDHIPDADVRRLAHPGLVVRRIDLDVILDVLAKPCGLKIDRAGAEELMAALVSEATLVERASDGALVHRSDVRAMMLPALWRSAQAKVVEIHQRAVRHYAANDGVVAATEEAYHRLMLGESGATIDDLLDRADVDSLVRSADELPPAAQVALAAHAPDLRLRPEVLAEASDSTWAHLERPRVRSLMMARRWDEALSIVQSRQTSDRASLLPLEEAEILEDLGWVGRALKVAETALESARLRGDLADVRTLTRTVTRLLEKLGRLTDAVATVEKLIDVSLKTPPPREFERAMEELIDVATWLRLERKQRSALRPRRRQDRQDAMTAYAAKVVDTIPDQVLARRPSLLRDLAGDVGGSRPGLRGSRSGRAVSWGFVSGVARGLVGVIALGR